MSDVVVSAEKRIKRKRSIDGTIIIQAIQQQQQHQATTSSTSGRIATTTTTTITKHSQVKHHFVEDTNANRRCSSGSQISIRTFSPTARLTCKWVIESFSSYVSNAFEKPNCEFVVCSPAFGPEENESIQFYLSLFPMSDDGTAVGLYLNNFNRSPAGGGNVDSQNMRVQLDCCALDSEGQEFVQSKFADCCFEFDGWGSDEFIRHKDLFDPMTRLLPNDTLTILVKVTCFSNKVSSYTYSNDNLERMYKQAQCEVNEDLGRLLSLDSCVCGEVPGDVTIVVGGGKRTFHLHRVILMARSPVFRAMFTHDLAEKQQNCVHITDLKAEVFEVLIRFIYTGKVTDLRTIGVDLLIAADKYQIESLKTLCSHYLGQSLTIETVATLLLWSDRHSADHLRDRCVSFICQHCTQVLQTAGWKSLLRERPDLAASILQEYVTSYKF